MNSFDIEDLRGITYQQSMATGAQIELEAMKAVNARRFLRGQEPAFVYEDFMALIDKYQLGHNAVIDNLHWSNR